MDKGELIRVLTANRAQHVADYEATLQKYFEELQADLLHQVELAAQRQPIDLRKLWSNHQQPTSYVDSYDRALQMLGHHLDGFVALDENSYRRYVQNEWEWKNDFAAATSKYLGK
jgi:hypothetical protein